ncbi:TRAM domain-containing protein [Candidatus Woesearchaeota archaeon]|nr:MAG: TRAM domain-containing protein [Candidatus Woesearchaeota archaeon]
MRNQRFDRPAAPVREGDELDVTIEAVGEKGDGIAKKEGFVLIVPGAKQGDSVKVKVTRVLKSLAFTEVLGPAEQRETKQEQQQPAQEEPEEDFDPQEHLDSENFGEEDAEDEKPATNEDVEDADEPEQSEQEKQDEAEDEEVPAPEDAEEKKE